MRRSLAGLQNLPRHRQDFGWGYHRFLGLDEAYRAQDAQNHYQFSHCSPLLLIFSWIEAAQVYTPDRLFRLSCGDTSSGGARIRPIPIEKLPFCIDRLRFPVPAPGCRIGAAFGLQQSRR